MWFLFLKVKESLCVADAEGISFVETENNKKYTKLNYLLNEIFRESKEFLCSCQVWNLKFFLLTLCAFFLISIIYKGSVVILNWCNSILS